MKDSSTATERVGRYQLLEPIGGGPNGMVARAKVFGVAGFERQFAVKRFVPDLTQGAAAQALSQAARSYGSLEHPRIARMSEFGVAQGQTFTAVEYVAGLDVFRLLQEAKLASVAIAAGGALALVSQAARAVGYAHGRGLSHLGLSPTNVIVTADGDVKVTDFGILAATMPPRPAESARLASRVPYLAPEQVAGEATSAATDVFVLGVIAYELVTGQRAYRGESPAAVAQAILAGPPIEPTLPRPIVRVLQRCLARSPFERFPDARALADALDAALRVAPVPGTRKDVGAQVKTTLERYAQLNEGNVSGMVALNLQGQPIIDDSATQPLPRRPEARTEPSPVPTFNQPPPTLPAMPRASGLAGSTHKDLAKPTATVPGLAPPPIPVPPGVQPPPGAMPKIPGSNTTIPGMPGSKPQIPSLPKMTNATTQPGTGTPPSRPTPPPSPPARPTPMPQVPAKVGSLTQGWDAVDPADFPDPPTSKVDSAPSTIPDPIASVTDEPAFSLGDDGRMSTQDEPTQMGLQPPGAGSTFPFGAKRPTPGHSFDSTTGEMSMAQLDALNKKALLPTSEIAPVSRRPDDVITKPVNVAQMPIAESARGRNFDDEPSVEMQVLDGPSSIDQMIDQVVQDAASTMEVPRDVADASSTMPSLSPPPPERPSSQPSISVPMPAAASSRPEIVASASAARPPAPASTSKLPLVAGIVLAVGVLGAGGYYAYTQFVAAKEPTVAQGSGSAVVAMGSDKPVVEHGGSAKTGSAETGSAGSAGSAATGSGDTGSAGSAGSAETGSAGSAETGSAGSAGSAETGSAGSATGSAEGSGSAGSNAVATSTGSAGSNGSNTSSEPTNTPSVTPSQKSDQLEVTTTPPGARVFLDGAEIGKTPMKTPGSADRHTLAVLLPDHELYIAEVDGAGVYNVTLNAVTFPKSGPGIKIETCKAKNRYYIYVDGVASGQTCPTAKRIVTTLGKHVVEVYDIVTETRKKYEVNIVDDRLSVRVKIDE